MSDRYFVLPDRGQRERYPEYLWSHESNAPTIAHRRIICRILSKGRWLFLSGNSKRISAFSQPKKSASRMRRSGMLTALRFRYLLRVCYVPVPLVAENDPLGLQDFGEIPAERLLSHIQGATPEAGLMLKTNFTCLPWIAALTPLAANVASNKPPVGEAPPS